VLGNVTWGRVSVSALASLRTPGARELLSREDQETAPHRAGQRLAVGPIPFTDGGHQGREGSLLGASLYGSQWAPHANRGYSSRASRISRHSIWNTASPGSLPSTGVCPRSHSGTPSSPPCSSGHMRPSRPLDHCPVKNADTPEKERQATGRPDGRVFANVLQSAAATLSPARGTLPSVRGLGQLSHPTQDVRPMLGRPSEERLRRGGESHDGNP
jgi:hypothetical protein